MILSTITGLRADILPHRQWAISRWYYANPLWYYHRWGTSGAIVPNRRFYQLVDPELRTLCRLLNERGITTTPSCQGHFYPKDHFQRIWEQLKREEDAIGRLGLLVRDSETDHEHVFQDNDYAVPWPDFATFYRQATEHQGTGYLGIVIPLHRRDLAEAFARLCHRTPSSSISQDEELGAVLGGSLFNLLVQPRDPDERARMWSGITQAIRDVIENTPTPAYPATPYAMNIAPQGHPHISAT